jgi:hypothetical protein
MLGRLSKAETQGPQWGINYTFDGYGNKLGQSVSKGTAASHSFTMQTAANPHAANQTQVTNRIVGQNYSSSGELTSLNGVSLGYDGFGRNTQVGQQTWWHSGAGAGADRVLVQKQNGSTTTQKIAFYAGALLQECEVLYTDPNWPYPKGLLLGTCTNRYYLAGRRVDDAQAIRDSKWNSTRKFPFGEDALTSGSYTEEDHFASYRGAGDGVAIDYARHRSYAPTLGTFTSPDHAFRGSVEEPPK